MVSIGTTGEETDRFVTPLVRRLPLLGLLLLTLAGCHTETSIECAVRTIVLEKTQQPTS